MLDSVASLTLQLREVQTRLQASQVKASGVCVGDIVVINGVDCLVSQVIPRSFHDTWLEVVPRRKDGTFDIADRALYSDYSSLALKIEGEFDRGER